MRISDPFNIVNNTAKNISNRSSGIACVALSISTGGTLFNLERLRSYQNKNSKQHQSTNGAFGH